MIAELCGVMDDMFKFTTTYNRVYIQMHTSPRQRYGGFRAHYTISAVPQTGMCLVIVTNAFRVFYAVAVENVCGTTVLAPCIYQFICATMMNRKRTV